MSQEHVNICPFREQLTAGGYLEGFTPPDLDARYAANPELEKIDLYVHLIPAVDQIVSTMIDKQPEPVWHVKSFQSLEAQATSGLGQAISEYVTRLGDDAPVVILARRKEGNPGLPLLLSKGANTATRSMHKLFRQIPYAYKQKYGEFSDNAGQLTDIARKNYPFLRQLAQQHIVELDAQQTVGNINKRDHFSTFMSYTALDENDMLLVDPSIHSKFPTLFDATGQIIRQEHATPEVWCPALYSKALYSLWNWHLTRAEIVYKTQIEEQQESIVIFPNVESLSAD